MTQAPAMPVFRYRAFISYSHRDKSWADWLHKALETYAIPKRLVGQTTAAGVIPRRLAPIFRDREELASATDLGRKVNEALRQSANLIVICSPHSATSHWVNEEVLAFKRLGRSERIFCLIVDGEPTTSDLPGQQAQQCFAHALRYTLGADDQLSARRSEPIAADARAGKDGKGNAKLKLISGLLDLDYDTLKQRELKRRNRRMAAITALALVVTGLTTTLAIAALFARHAAVVASIDAERRQKQAENLVGFMLGDLNDKLAQVQRLDIMEAVDDKAMAYFASLPTSDVTDKALAARAKALEKIGAVRMNQGHLPAAMESFQAAAKLAGTLANAAATDVARQLQYARTLVFMGTDQWDQGQLDAAQISFEAAQNVLLRTARVAVSDRELQFELEMIDNNIGHVLEARGQLDRAGTLYQSALTLASKLVTADPDNIAWAVELGGAHNNLGKLALLHGDLATAITEYRADDAIETALAASHPEDNSQRESMLTVRAILGRTLALAGENTTAKQYLQQAVDLAAALVKVDPRNSSFQEDFALYTTQLARLQRLDGDPSAAQTLTTRALPILRDLSRQDPTNTGYQGEYAEAMIEQAAVWLAIGKPDQARTQLLAALAILEPLQTKQPRERSTLLDEMNGHLLLAQISADPKSALQLRHDVWVAARSQPMARSDPRLLAVEVETLIALGRSAEAEPIIQQLWGSGYRDTQLLSLLARTHIAYPINLTFQKQPLGISDRY